MKKLFYVLMLSFVVSIVVFFACGNDSSISNSESSMDSEELVLNESDIQMINDLYAFNAEFIGQKTRSNPIDSETPDSIQPYRRRSKWAIVIADVLGGVAGGLLSGGNTNSIIIGAVFASSAWGFNNGTPQSSQQNGVSDILSTCAQSVFSVESNPIIIDHSPICIQNIPEEYRLVAEESAFVHNASLELIRTGDLSSFTNLSAEYEYIITDTTFVNRLSNIVYLMDNMDQFATLAGNCIETTIFYAFAHVFAYVQTQDDVNNIINRYIQVIKINRTLTPQTKGYIYTGLAIAAYSFDYWNSLPVSEE